jgi:hypothetical protein
MARERRTSSRSSKSSGSSSNKGSKTTGYVTLFEIKENDEGKEYVQFVKNAEYVNIEVNGVNVNGKSIYINDPAEKFEIMLEKEMITEEEAEEKIGRIPEYILEEGTVKLD